MDSEVEPSGTGIRVFPPLVFALAVGAAFGAHRLIPLSAISDGMQLWVGSILIIAGLVLAGAAVLQFRAHKTTIHVGHSASALMTSGPFKFSRNPVYVALMAISLGICVAFDRMWIIPFLALAILYLQRHVIDLEEAFLEAKFGDDYRTYKSKVRRWF